VFPVLARYQANGTPDPNFGNNGVVNGDGLLPILFTADAAVILSDGRILVAGTQSGSVAVARFTASGSLDSTFGSGGSSVLNDGHSQVVRRIALENDGKILVCGYSTVFLTVSGLFNEVFFLARFLAGGGPDLSLGQTGIVTTRFSTKLQLASLIVPYSDGKVLLAGFTNNGVNPTFANVAMARYNSDGSLDTTFGRRGKRTQVTRIHPAFWHPLALQADGKIVGVGHDRSGKLRFVRLLQDGNLDRTFDPRHRSTLLAGLPFPSVVNSLAVQGDGKLVLTGFDDGTQLGALARYLGTP
jgi:uncharacterized delta-60 repeat protein